MKRRDFVKFGFVLSATAAIALYAKGMMGQMMGMSSQEEIKDSSNAINRLKIPQEIKGSLVNGIREYNLTLKSGVTEFFKNLKTTTWGVNDNSFLGPTIRLTKGEKVSINWHNRLNVDTTMHSHGMHLPASADGNAHQVIKANSSWSAKYVVNQKACTNWYHPHIMNHTAEHVLMGLGGLIIIDDEESLNSTLPKRYGIDDIPLILQDRLFTRDGNFAYSKNIPTIMHGFKGDTLLVNGTYKPYFEAEAGLLRVRLLNASNSRVYRVGSNGAKMSLIAGDNSFLEKEAKLDSVVLSPAERAEIVLDLNGLKGKKIVLKDVENGFNILEIRVTKDKTINSKIPKKLTSLEPINLNSVKRTREFKLQMAGPGRLLINGKSMNIDRIDEVVKLNEYEIWEVENSGMMGMMGKIMGGDMMGMYHNFHMHATHFRVLERNGSRFKVRAWERAYKDTIFLAPGDRVKLLVKHTDYADSKVPYMYHCHILEHEDAGMMGQFTVVKG